MTKWLSLPRLEQAAGILWGLVLLTLPATTFRYIPSFFGTTLVKPMALYPLAVLFPLLVFIAWRRREISWPHNSTPLLVFILIALLSTLIAALYAPLDLRGQYYWGRTLRAWVSLGVGLVFLLCAFWMNRTQADLHRSLKWLYVGLGLTIIWGGLQILAIETPVKPSWIDVDLLSPIQKFFASRRVQSNRISGFAYEASWLADQIVIFYAPWLFAALLTGYRLTRFKWLEPLLLFLVLGLLLFTFSRSGIFNFLIVSLLVFLLVGRQWVAKLWSWFLAPFVPGDPRSLKAALFDKMQRLAIVMVAALILVAGGYQLLRHNYFGQILNYEGSFLEYVLVNSAGPRMAYAVASLKTYSNHPWTGVGLGAAGFYLLENLPDWILTMHFEVARSLSPDSLLFPNSKNLYVRLLAETGLVGFWAFTAYFLSFLAEVRAMFLSAKPHLRYAAIAGLFIWLAAALRNFSQDSLTFPVMWVGLGIIVGLAASHSPKQNEHLHN